jgi:hypothetical protein
MLEVAQAIREEVVEASGSAHYEHVEQSEHSVSAHTPTPPLASLHPVDSSERTTSVSISKIKSVFAESTSPHSVSKEGTSLEGTASEHTPTLSPNDYTSTGGFQTPGGDEGVKGPLDNYALTREFRRMKKVINNQAAEIKRLRNKFRRLKRFVWPLVQNFRLYVKEQKKSKKKKSKSAKKVSKSKRSKKKSSFKLGRNQEDNLNEDDIEFQYSEDAYFWNYPEEPLNFVPENKTDGAENIVQEKDVENIVQEDNIDVQETENQGDNIQSTHIQSTDVQSTVDESTGMQSTGVQGTAAMHIGEIGTSTAGLSTKAFEDEACPSNPLQQEEVKEHTASDDETIAQIMLNLDRPTGIHISEPAQQVSDYSSEPEALDPKDKGKGIMKEIKKKKKKFTLAQLREIEIAKNEEIAR